MFTFKRFVKSLLVSVIAFISVFSLTAFALATQGNNLAIPGRNVDDDADVQWYLPPPAADGHYLVGWNGLTDRADEFQPGTGLAWDGLTWKVSGAPESLVTNLTSDLAAKEPTIASGTTSQYWRGDKTWQTLPAAPTTYLNQNIQSGVKVWYGQATTTSGVATFFPTSDNTGSGTALCSTVLGIQVTAESNTASAIVAPFASVKAVASDKKSISVNAINGVNLLVLGASTAFAPNGTNVYLTLTCE